MDIFGLTPTDTALSVLGLNYAQRITDFLFRQTHLATLVFIAASLISVWQVMRTGSYRPLLVCFFLSVSVILLILPSRGEGTVKSAYEHGVPNAQSAQDLKNQLTDVRHIPVILGFIAQVSNAFIAGVINIIDTTAPQWARFFPTPFSVQLDCLYIREAIHNGISDLSLHDRLRAFIHDQYVPALSMLKHDAPDIDLNTMWPGHDRVLVYCSPEVKQSWSDLEKDLISYWDKDPRLAADAREKIGQMANSDQQGIEQSMIKAIVQHQLNVGVQKNEGGLFWNVNGQILGLFPYIYGGANLILYVVFPFLVMVLVMVRRVSVLAGYVKTFVWVKSWMLSGVLSSYASLFLARASHQAAPPDPYGLGNSLIFARQR